MSLLGLPVPRVEMSSHMTSSRLIDVLAFGCREVGINTTERVKAMLYISQILYIGFLAKNRKCLGLGSHYVGSICSIYPYDVELIYF